MATKAEGIWGCRVIDAGAFEGDNGATIVRVNVQLTDGPDKGQRCTYEDTLNTKSEKYIRWSCEAVGWKGASMRTLQNDVAKWISETGGDSTVEIKHVEVKRGKAYDKWVTAGCNGAAPVWDKVNGIGRGAPRPLKPLSDSALKEADEILRMANGDSGTPPEDAGDPNDIPFISCNSIIGLGEIAAVLK